MGYFFHLFIYFLLLHYMLNLCPTFSWVRMLRDGLEYEYICYVTWWYHDMETLSALLVLCEGNPPMTGGRFPHKGPVMQRFSIVFVYCLNKQSIKQSSFPGDLRCHDVTFLSHNSLWTADKISVFIRKLLHVQVEILYIINYSQYFCWWSICLMTQWLGMATCLHACWFRQSFVADLIDFIDYYRSLVVFRGTLLQYHGNQDMEMLMAFCEGNPSVTSGFPSQRTSDAELWCFFDVSLNKLLNKQLRGSWTEMCGCSFDVTVLIHSMECFATVDVNVAKIFFHNISSGYMFSCFWCLKCLAHFTKEIIPHIWMSQNHTA